METSDNGNIPWDDVIKKEARGIDDYSLGEVRQVTSEYHAITHKGVVNTKWFQIPKHLAQEFDGNQLILKVTEKRSKRFVSNMSHHWKKIRETPKQLCHW